MRKMICLILVSMLITPAFAADWSMFKNDPSHSGYTDDVINPPLSLKWTKNLGFETDSSPVIVNGILYIGTTFGIHALDAKTGKEVWRYNTKGFVKAVPAVSNDILYIGADDNQLYAIDARAGTLKWNNNKALDGYTSSPAVINNRVYSLPRDGSFYAFDINNGEIVWNTLIGKVSESSPAIGEGIITFGTDGGDIIGLDASTGKEKWRYNTGVTDIKSSPAIADGTVFIGSNDGSLYAISADKGALKWKYSTNDNILSSPSVKNGVVYFGGRDSNFFAIDMVTGKLKWKYPNSGQIFSAPAISNDVVYFGTKNNFIYGLNANSGELLFRNSTGQDEKDYITSPAISGNMLFAVTHSGILYAYSQASGPAPTVAVKETVSVPTSAPTPVPSVIITPAPPVQTRKSPGFEFPIMILLIMAGIARYNKKK